MAGFAKLGLQTLGLSALARGLGIGMGIVLARSLGPGGKGDVAYAALALELFVVAVGGISQAVTVQYARNGQPGGAVYRAMLRIVAALALPAMVVLALVALLVPSQRALIWAALAVPFATYGEATIGLLIGAGRIGVTNVQRAFTSTVFNAAAIVAVLAFHADAQIVLALWFAGYVAAASYAAYAVRPYVRDTAPSGDLVREQATFAAKASSASVAGYINMRIDVVVVSLLLGAQALGNYTLAITTAELLWQLSQPFFWAAMGQIAMAPLDESAAFTAKVMRHVVALCVPLGVLMFVAGPMLIGVVYGNAFAPAGSALRWILPGVVAYAIEFPLGYFLMIKLGRPLLIVAIQTASILICSGLAFATVRRWGIDGAAAATSLTYVGVVITKAVVFVRATGTPVRDLLLLHGDDLTRILESRRLAPFTARFRTRLSSAGR